LSICRQAIENGNGTNVEKLQTLEEIIGRNVHLPTLVIHYHGSRVAAKVPQCAQASSRASRADRVPSIIRSVLFPRSINAPAARATLFKRVDEYQNHLQNAFAELGQWIKDAAKEGLQLEASVVPLVPLSINFVDPSYEEGEGLAVITPNAFEHIPERRPSFVISKRESSNLFNAYWVV